MATWWPQDGSHAPIAGAPDGWCYLCKAYCGGENAAGTALVCKHCADQGLPPAGTDARSEDRVPETGFGSGGNSPGDPYATTTNTTGSGINPGAAP